MSKNPITIPENTTHFFANTKNKKTFYSGSEKEGWSIHNKGLDTWEKVPNLDLTLTPIEELSISDDSLTIFSDIENADYAITNVKSKKHEDVKEDFRTPALSLVDLRYVYDLFDKYSEGVPLGFIPKESNFAVYFDYELDRWTWMEDNLCECLTIYTTNFNTIEKVLNDLNQI